MIKIFISYRRQDAPYAAWHINDALRRRFGKRNVYFDLDTNQPGFDFREQISSKLSKCDVMLVIIGDQWLKADDSNRTRLGDPGDIVAWEVSSALELGIPVIPVLVQGANMPSPESLPAKLTPLAFRHAVEIRVTENFQASIARLINSIGSITSSQIPKFKASTLEKLNRLLWVSVSVATIQHVLTLLYLFSPKNLGMGFFMLGFVVLLGLGVYISAKSYALNFGTGLYKGVLIPIVALLVWFVVYTIFWNTPLPQQTSLISSVVVSAVLVISAYIRLLRELRRRDSNETVSKSVSK